VFLKVTPQPDGTFTVETLYLPDPEKEYVIESHSVMGSYASCVRCCAIAQPA
jgi:hypothetical protein